MRKDTRHHESNNNPLCEQASSVNIKIKTGSATYDDYILLEELSKIFISKNKHPEYTFCKKLQVKFLFQTYKQNSDTNEAAEELESIHDQVVDLLVFAETKKVATSSIYNVFLKIKYELASVMQVHGFYKDASALQKCAHRIYNKAVQRFPSYEKFTTTQFQNI